MSMLTHSSDHPPGLPGPTQDHAAQVTAGLTPGDILAMLHRRLVLIVVLCCFLTVLAVGGFVAWWTYYPGFTAESLIECISNVPEVGLNIQQIQLRQEEHERFVMSQAVALKSQSVLEEALKVAAVRETDWFKSIQQPEEHPILELDDALRVTPMRGTNFLRVRMTTRKREDPAVIVNEVVGRWYESVRRRAAEELVAQRISDAQQERSDLQKDIAEKRRRVTDIVARLPAGAAQTPSDSILHQRVQTLTTQVEELNKELLFVKQYRDYYNAPGAVAPTAEDRAAVEADPQVALLANTLFQLEQQRAADAAKFGAQHRTIRDANARIAAAEEKLAALRTEKLGERLQEMRETTNTSFLNTQNALLERRETLDEAEAALQDQDQLITNMKMIEQEIDVYQTRERALDDYILEANRIVRQQSAVNINIAQPATDPLVQSTPSIWVLPLGIFLAIALAVGFGLFLELLDKSVKTPQQILRYVSVAVLGVVPHTDDEEVAIDKPETALRDAPQSITAESFRRIRTNLRYCSPPDRQRTLLITSPRVDDGKTTVACNIALACAFDGMRVLLIDGSIRRPGLHHAFDQIGETGLSNILIGDASLESAVVNTDVATLDVLGAGPVSPSPVELLGSEGFRRLLAEAAQRYDKILLDTAPVLLTADALVTAPVVDGVVLVVRAAANSKGAVQRACSLLTDVNAHMLGIVLNAAQVTRGGYFREQFRAYYEYQTDVPRAKLKKLTK